MPYLEQRKKQLQEIRNFYKPIGKEDFIQHKQKYESLRKEKAQQLELERKTSLKELKQHQEKLPFKANFESVGGAEAKKNKLQLEVQEQSTKEKKEKLENYAKYVREMYWPKASVKKQLELEHIKSMLHNKPIRNSTQDLQVAEINKDGKQQAKSYEKPWRDAMSKPPSTIDAQRGKSTAKIYREDSQSEANNIGTNKDPLHTLLSGAQKNSKSIGGINNAQISRKEQELLRQKREKREEAALSSLGGHYGKQQAIDSELNLQGQGQGEGRRKHVDYLTEMRIQKQQQGNQLLQVGGGLTSSSSIKSLSYLQGCLNQGSNNQIIINQVLRNKNLSQQEKFEAVRFKALQIEEQAKKQEKLILMAKRRHPLKGVDRDQLHAENVEKTIAVNDMYIDAIHAKLRLLESI